MSFCFICQNRSVQLLVKDVLSRVQHTPVKSNKSIDECDDDVDDGAGSDAADETDRPFKKLDDSISGQVNILVSASQQLLEGDVRKQVSGYHL